jgi:hypothetical protein
VDDSNLIASKSHCCLQLLVASCEVALCRSGRSSSGLEFQARFTSPETSMFSGDLSARLIDIYE